MSESDVYGSLKTSKVDPRTVTVKQINRSSVVELVKYSIQLN